MALYPAGNVNPVRSTGLRHAYQKYIIRWGLDRGWCYCAVHAWRVMNNENSMGWRQTQLTDRGCWCHPFTQFNVTRWASRRLSTSLTRAVGCPLSPHLCVRRAVILAFTPSLPFLPGLLLCAFKLPLPSKGVILRHLWKYNSRKENLYKCPKRFHTDVRWDLRGSTISLLWVEPGWGVLKALITSNFKFILFLIIELALNEVVQVLSIMKCLQYIDQSLF